MLCLCLYFVFVLVLFLPCISVFWLCFVLRITAGAEVDVVRSRLQATSFTGGLLLLPLDCLLSADIAFLRRQGTHCLSSKGGLRGGGLLASDAKGPPLLSQTHLISCLPSPPPDSRQEARCPLSHIASSTTFKTDIKVTSCHLCTFHARNTLMIFFPKGRNTHIHTSPLVEASYPGSLQSKSVQNFSLAHNANHDLDKHPGTTAIFVCATLIKFLNIGRSTVWRHNPRRSAGVGKYPAN